MTSCFNHVTAFRKHGKITAQATFASNHYITEPCIPNNWDLSFPRIWAMPLTTELTPHKVNIFFPSRTSNRK
jgi:hypothetical protein